MAEIPVLPYGSSSTLSGLSETFAFHASPERFITARVVQFRSSHPELAESRFPIRAKILKRNVAVISSYSHVKRVLCELEISELLSASKAYDELMAPFFPPPNLLLTDPPEHGREKSRWLTFMHERLSNVGEKIENIMLSHFAAHPSGVEIDLYESMKTLAWKLILNIFLADGDSYMEDEEFASQVISLQDYVLRGQFSLFPVSISTRFWTSPRAKALKARQMLQQLLKSHLYRKELSRFDAAKKDDEAESLAREFLLFTSSIAAKALASLLTALMLNLFSNGLNGKKRQLIERIRALARFDERADLIKSIILETERLSPPVVGIMRRTTKDVILGPSESHEKSILIPRGWDMWLYFVGAARDPAMFGTDADLFQPDRYCKGGPKANEGFAFGRGPKTCLGQKLIRNILTKFVHLCLGDQADSLPLDIQAPCKNEMPVGVQGWLGWRADVPAEEWARDMKQLPTQRPRQPVKVTLIHNLDISNTKGSKTSEWIQERDLPGS